MPRRVIADKHWFRQRCEIITDYFFRQRFRGEQMSSPSESQCRGYAIPPRPPPPRRFSFDTDRIAHVES